MTGLEECLVALEGAHPLRVSPLVYPRAAIEAAAAALALSCTVQAVGDHLLVSVADPARLDLLLEAVLLGAPQ